MDPQTRSMESESNTECDDIFTFTQNELNQDNHAELTMGDFDNVANQNSVCKQHKNQCIKNKNVKITDSLCAKCGSKYNRIDLFKEHTIRCNGVGKLKCFYSNCSERFKRKIKLVEHITREHGLKDPVTINFKTLSHFEVWKSEEETRTSTCFANHRGCWNKGDRFFFCHHGGCAKLHKKFSGPRFRTSCTNFKGDITCTAMMHCIRIVSGSWKVIYYESHSHPLNVSDRHLNQCVTKTVNNFDMPIPKTQSGPLNDSGLQHTSSGTKIVETLDISSSKTHTNPLNNSDLQPNSSVPKVINTSSIPTPITHSHPLNVGDHKYNPNGTKISNSDAVSPLLKNSIETLYTTMLNNIVTPSTASSVEDLITQYNSFSYNYDFAESCTSKSIKEEKEDRLESLNNSEYVGLIKNSLVRHSKFFESSRLKKENEAFKISSNLRFSPQSSQSDQELQFERTEAEFFLETPKQKIVNVSKLPTEKIKVEDDIIKEIEKHADSNLKLLQGDNDGDSVIIIVE